MKQYDRIYCKVKIQLIYHILNNITKKNIFHREYHKYKTNNSISSYLIKLKSFFHEQTSIYHQFMYLGVFGRFPPSVFFLLSPLSI